MKKKMLVISASLLALLVGLLYPQVAKASPPPPEQVIQIYTEVGISKVVVARSGKDKVYQTMGVSPVSIIVNKKDKKVTLRFFFGKTERQIVLFGQTDLMNRRQYTYPTKIYYDFNLNSWNTDGKPQTETPMAEVKDPTIRAGESNNMVNRDNPGATALERTIIRWFFDSEPRGSRLFWRIISSVPDQVKNSNESYLGSTPYEETRSFNILGLTYENSRDVTIEVKVTRTGYMDQVKRFNVRQAIDQQEISSFFELVKQ